MTLFVDCILRIVREELQEIDIDNRMQLYYVDINSISNINNIPYVRQQGDYIGKGALLKGSLGAICYNNDLSNNLLWKSYELACATQS